MKKNKTIDFIKTYGLLLIIVGPIIGFLAMIIFSGANTKSNVHWHMPISYDLCGNTTQLKDDGEHGKLHGHNDNQAHVEGVVDMENRTETLGAFFDTTNIIFSSTKIGNYKNGDKCKGSNSPGKVSVLINGKENNEFRDYIMNDKDEIQIIFK